MALSIGELTGYLDLDAGPFDKAIGSAMDTLGSKKWQVVGAAAGLAAGTAIASGLLTSMNTEKALNKLTGALGLTKEESGKAGTAAGELYANNYGASMEDVTGAVESVMSSIKGMRGASSADIQDVTKDVLNLASAFEIDAGRAAQVAGQMITSGLAVDAKHAADLLAGTLQSVPKNVREDIMDAVDEYSPFMATLGIKGEEAMGILATASEKGMYGIDKTGDALKEFTIRATDMSKATSTAYDALGMNQEDMTAKLLAGGDTAKTAFNAIIQGLSSMDDPVAQSQAALALFGTPLEDLSVNEIPKFLNSIDPMGDKFDSLKGKAAELDSTLGGGAANAWTKFQRSGETAMSALGAQILPILTPLIEKMSEWAPILGPLVLGLGVLAGVIWLVTAATAAWSAVMALNPVTWIVLGIVALIAAIVLLVMNWDTVVKFITDAWGGFIGWFTGIMDGFFGWWNGVWGTFFSNTMGMFEDFNSNTNGMFMDFFNNTMGMFSDFFTRTIGMFVDFGTNTGGMVADFVTNTFGMFSDFFTRTAGMFVDFFTNTVGMFADFGAKVGAVIGIGVDFIRGLWDGFWNGMFGQLIIAAWDLVVAVVTYGVQWVQFIIETALAYINAVWTIAWNTIVSVFTSIWNSIVAFITPIINAIATAIATVVAFIADTWTTVWSAISAFFTAIWTAMLDVAQTVTQAVADTVHGVLDWISGVWNATWNGILSFFTSVWNAIIGFLTPIIQSVVSTVSGGLNTASGIVSSVLGSIGGFFRDTWNGITSGVSSAFNTVVSTVRGKIDEFFGLVNGIKDKVMGAFAGAGGWLLDAGQKIIGGLIQGFKDMIGGITDTLKNITDLIPKNKGPEARDKKLLTGNGRLIMGSLIDGFESMYPKVVSSLGGLTNSLGGMSPTLNVGTAGGRAPNISTDNRKSVTYAPVFQAGPDFREQERLARTRFMDTLNVYV